MQVETRTRSRLHLKRAPGLRSWSLLVGKAEVAEPDKVLPAGLGPCLSTLQHVP